MPPRILFPKAPMGARTQTRSSAFGGRKEREGKRKREKNGGIKEYGNKRDIARKKKDRAGQGLFFLVVFYPF